MLGPLERAREKGKEKEREREREIETYNFDWLIVCLFYHIMSIFQNGNITFTMTTANIAFTPLSSYTYSCQFLFQNTNSQPVTMPATCTSAEFMCNSPPSNQIPLLTDGQGVLIFVLIQLSSRVLCVIAGRKYKFNHCYSSAMSNSVYEPHYFIPCMNWTQ